MQAPPQAYTFLTLLMATALTAGVLLVSPSGYAQPADAKVSLTTLTREREELAAEYEEYRKTLEILGAGDDGDPTQSTNPVIRNLAVEMVKIKSRIITIIEKEVILLQQQITEAESVASEVGPLTEEELESPSSSSDREATVRLSEEEKVQRLLSMLAQHYAEIEEAKKTVPAPEVIEQRRAIQRDAATLARIPFSSRKVRLSGTEGSIALARISQRLNDESIPHNRRDVPRIGSIKTRMHGSLIAGQNRSLVPVGKNNYVAKVQLQPGDTTIQIGSDNWDLTLPESLESQDYIITLYIPPSGKPELHVFSVADLLAQDNPYIPAWLPSEFGLPSPPG